MEGSGLPKGTEGSITLLTNWRPRTQTHSYESQTYLPRERFNNFCVWLLILDWSLQRTLTKPSSLVWCGTSRERCVRKNIMRSFYYGVQLFLTFANTRTARCTAFLSKFGDKLFALNTKAWMYCQNSGSNASLHTSHYLNLCFVMNHEDSVCDPQTLVPLEIGMLRVSAFSMCY